ncbi:prolyl-tRNA synthetase [Blattabacterium sp. (Periplaneta americana) str. BPLAN]|uniref:proline--tRNA ligase n=1 Tax=Blattabacterium sp. (Periplaneta americana) TaxID=367488 RepID=UPI0001BA0B72|nr:proline--tRNA ligase [Blattabacterium sp. (Periplaneta americana)]ACX83756.1 prolyl-tRNA synthetase [Blattabacterium sp. (Periplaneta americana) str. BPLAN]
MHQLTKRNVDYSKWYNEIIIRSGLAEFSGIRGFMIIKPYGFSIWEIIKNTLDKMFKETGHKNVYFPMLIPKSSFSKEKKHIANFSKECAIVTHCKLKKNTDQEELTVDPKSKLQEELVIRPTSESIIWKTFRHWIHSYRDLPLLLNQWGNAIRWEMRTRLFLRTSEFLWQEGHTAHSTEKEAIEETKKILNIYTDFSEKIMAIPVVQGMKPYMDKFSGSETTFSLEAMMQDGKALQIGTSHFLGQNFSKAFDVKFTNKNGKKEYVWSTSWGVSTRLIGGIVMLHSDDHGLILPPKIAPIQIVIIPIYKNKQELSKINEIAERIQKIIKEKGFSVKYDNREIFTPGWKFHEYEMKGIPIRINIGLDEIIKEKAEVFRRDTYEKVDVSWNQIITFIPKLLEKIQKNLYQRALNRTKKLTMISDHYEDFKKKINGVGGFILAHWDGTKSTGKKIQEETEATIRCIPISTKKEGGRCIYSGNPSSQRVVFAKSY